MNNNKNRTIIKDIQTFCDLVKKYDLYEFLQTYPLEEIIGHPNEALSVNIEDLTLKIPSSSMKPIPYVKLLEVIMSLQYDYPSNSDDTEDVFNKYQLNISLKGYNDPSHCNPKFFCWHLDKEPQTNGRFIHPLYHFHAGGKDLKDNPSNQTDSFVISSPRLAHPPMDIILSIHFLIQNFVNGNECEWKDKLLADDDYIRIVQDAQERVLNPYFNAITSDANSNVNYNKMNLFPLYR